MVHGPVYRGYIPTAGTLSQDMCRAKVGLLRPQSRFLAGRKIEEKLESLRYVQSSRASPAPIRSRVLTLTREVSRT